MTTPGTEHVARCLMVSLGAPQWGASVECFHLYLVAVSQILRTFSPLSLSKGSAQQQRPDRERGRVLVWSPTCRFFPLWVQS